MRIECGNECHVAPPSSVNASSANQSFPGLQEHWIEEVVKLRAHHDGNGDRLDGSTGKYELRFGPGQLPMVGSFWSVTVYDENFDLVPNSINRYSLGSVDKDLVTAKDGSLTLHLQSTPPVDEPASNWIPTPQGQFNLFMRAYLPDEALQRQDYVPPPVQKVSD